MFWNVQSKEAAICRILLGWNLKHKNMVKILSHTFLYVIYSFFGYTSLLRIKVYNYFQELCNLIDNETKSYDKFYLRVFITIKNNSIGLRFCAISELKFKVKKLTFYLGLWNFF